jgi:deazaflavin-dependent oxidoreductase (nitroreductase family)
MRLNLPTKLLWRIHRWLYAVSRGWIGSSFLGRRLVLLQTVGRRSGAPREVALYSFGERGKDVVVASYVGQPHHPGWYLNLKADSEARILERGKWSHVRARDALGGERERLWADITRRDPAYQEYQQRTTREIPIVILESVR